MRFCGREISSDKGRKTSTAQQPRSFTQNNLKMRYTYFNRELATQSISMGIEITANGVTSRKISTAIGLFRRIK